jgi:hypothetical protein
MKNKKIPHCRKSSKKYHTVGTVPESNREIVKRAKIDTHSTHIPDHSWSLSCLGIGTSIKSGRVKLVLGTRTS